MLKKLLMSLFIIFMILYTTISYAVSVTKENLNEAFQEFVLSDANEKNFKVELTDNTINITSNEGDYELEYDLTDKPTFTITIPIEKGMSYKEFEKRISNLNLPMLGYIAVANIQGIEIADAATYFLFSYLQDT